MKLKRSTSLAVAVAATCGLAATPGAASATGLHHCPTPKSGLLATRSLGKVWHQGKSLYACTEAYANGPKIHRMGPYTPYGKLSFDGYSLAWTVLMTKEGKRTDRVFAGDAYTGRRWMIAQKPNPAGATLAAREDRIQALRVYDTAVMWVTKGSAVVGALSGPQSEPEVIGTLPAPPVVQKHLTMIGTFPDVPAATLVASMKLADDPSKGDGDECGGVSQFLFTVKPGADADPAGISWYGGYERPDCG